MGTPCWGEGINGNTMLGGGDQWDHHAWGGGDQWDHHTWGGRGLMGPPSVPVEQVQTSFIILKYLWGGGRNSSCPIPPACDNI